MSAQEYFVMLISFLTRWFVRPAECAAPGRRPQVVAPAFRARCPAAVPVVEVAASPTSEGLVIRVKGEANVESAGALLSGLLAPAARRPAVVTLDLSELRSISCLAMGVLVAYRRGVVRTGGRVRLAEGLQPAVKEALARAGLFDLFEATPDAWAAPGPSGVPASGHASNCVAMSTI
jgi:anti-anti-sigma factor